MGIKEQVTLIKDSLKDYPNVNLIAATKYMDIDQTKELVSCGITKLGENRTDMFLEKYDALNGMGIEWHFFGVVQSRKIKDIVNKIDCLHSLDRYSLAVELNKRLEKTLDCFIQINISEEPNKQGIPASKLMSFVKQLASCDKINIVGLMCIAKLTFDKEEIRREFMQLKKLKEDVEALNLPYAPCHRLSMGMSNDYKIAIECGATDIRLGRIFLK
ncbi:MAG: YggS family pyridoxal phosphate-dependent enzyme [Bacilli bacterium]|nr:YggS family pyridoxal phosphate-dependent enzyme [Bacilli bacterium]